MTPVVMLLACTACPRSSPWAPASRGSAVVPRDLHHTGPLDGPAGRLRRRYFTSRSYRPVREISETKKQSAAIGVIYFRALGYQSCIVPVPARGVTILSRAASAACSALHYGASGMLGTMARRSPKTAWEEVIAAAQRADAADAASARWAR